MREQRIGSTIGAAFGLVFILVNAGAAFADPLAMTVRVLGVLAFLATIWFGVIRAPEGIGEPPSPTAMRTYNFAVLFEVIAIFGGAAILNALDLSDLVLPWVVVVVGAHFLPFANVFRAPQFLPLAWLLVAVGLLGGAATLLVDEVAGPATGVVAGFVLLGFSAAGARGQAPDQEGDRSRSRA